MDVGQEANSWAFFLSTLDVSWRPESTTATNFHGINEKAETFGALRPLYGSERLIQRGGSLRCLQLYTAVLKSQVKRNNGRLCFQNKAETEKLETGKNVPQISST